VSRYCIGAMLLRSVSAGSQSVVADMIHVEFYFYSTVLPVVGCDRSSQPTALTKDSAEMQPCVQSNPSLSAQGLVSPQASHCMYSIARRRSSRFPVLTGLLKSIANEVAVLTTILIPYHHTSLQLNGLFRPTLRWRYAWRS
jgi:hypothetical protein